MIDLAMVPADDAGKFGRQRVQGARPACGRPNAAIHASGSAPSRFGIAASILDRLDTRPLEARQRCRPWWRFW